jgi:hypothetical protein
LKMLIDEFHFLCNHVNMVDVDYCDLRQVDD